MRKSILVLYLLMLMSSMRVLAQFNAPEYNQDMWIPNGQVTSIEREGNTVYLGGDFTTMSPYTGGGALLNTTTGNLKNHPLVIGGENNGIGYVNAVVSDGNGGWYIGGDFTSVGGIARNRIAHILPDNILDLNWNPNANNTVYALAIADGILYAGGIFTNIGGQTRNRVAALNLTNGQATSWNPNADGLVKHIVVNGATTYLAGTFGNVGGQARVFLAAVNTANGAVTSWNPQPDAQVFDIEVDGTNVYLFGSFRKIGLIPRDRLAAVSTTTGALQSWNPGANQAIVSVEKKGSRFYITGIFNQIGGQSRSGIAALDIATGSVLTWSPGLQGQASCLVATPTSILAAGSFTGVGGESRQGLAEINEATGLFTAWNPRPSYGVACMAYDGNGIYVGGGFTTVGAVDRNKLAAVDASTGVITDWNPNLTGQVSTLTAKNGTVYVGGTFTAVGGQARSNLAAIDSATGLATSWDPSPDQGVDAITLKSTTLLVGGSFTSIAGQTRNRIAEIDLQTSLATSWNPNANNRVRCIAITGNTVFLGGTFTSIGGYTRNRIVEVDGTTALPTAFDRGSNGSVYCFAYHGTTLYVGGSFTQFGAPTRNNLASVNVSTGQVINWNPTALGAVWSLATDGTTLYAGGEFTAVNGVGRSRLVALPAASVSPTTWNPNPNTKVNSVFLYGNTVYVGGAFTVLSSRSRPYFTSLSTTLTCTPPATPTITAAGPTTFCAGGSVTLTAPAGFTYLWSTGETTRAITATTSNSYTVRVISGACTSAASTPVVVNAGPATPIVFASGSSALCAGSSITLSAPSGFSYLWSTNEITRDIVVSTAGSYTVRTISGSCTSAVSAATVITVNPLPAKPTITAGGPTTFATGGSVTLSAPVGMEYIWSTGETTQDITVSSTGTYTVRTISAGCTSAASDPVQVVVTLPTSNVWIWNGTADFTSTTNWNKGTLPTLSADSVVFQSGTCTIGQNRSLGRVFVASGAQIMLDAAGLDIQTQLNVEGNITGQAGSFISFSGGTRYIGSGRVEVNTLLLPSGRLDISSRIKVKEVDAQGQVFVHAPGELRFVTGHNHSSHWVHNASQSLVLDGPNQFVMETHLDTLNSSASGAWYNIGPPIQNYAVGNLEQGVRFASGTYNNAIPTSSSLYLYDPTDNTWPTNKGYTKASSASQTLTDQQGVRLWMTRARIKSGPLEFKGNPFLTFPLTYNLKYCAGSCTYTGSAANGYNLIKNPLLTGLTIGDATKTPRTGISGAVWTWRNALGQFATYAAGVGVNGGTGIIKPGQAFFVEATGPAATLQITYNSGEAENGSILRTAAIEDVVRLKLQQGNVILDETAIRFLPQATTAYDAAYDAAKMMGTSTSISSLMGNQRYAINALPLAGTTRIPLHLSAAIASQSISIETEALAQGTTLYLNHPSMSQPMLVQQGSTVQVQAGWDTGLELIVVPASITTLPSQLTPTLTLIPNPATTAVQLHMSGASITGVDVLDQLGRTVLTTTTLPNQTIDISSLAGGSYLVKASTAQGVVTKRLAIVR